MPAFLDPDLLARLSPISAKLYLVLISLADSPIPLARAPIETLAARSRLSRRSCYLALKQLLDLRLIARLPKKYHTPNTYLLLFAKSPAQPAAQPTPHPPIPAPIKRAPAAQKPPAPAPKNPNTQPPAPLLNQIQPPSIAHPAAPDLAAEEAQVRALFAQLSSLEQSLLLARAQQVLAQTSPCPPPANSPECPHIRPANPSEPA